jgi:hypothetical protein
MVLKKEYGKEKVVQFLEGELGTYLEHRKTSIEVPLSLVEKQSHIYYNKGAIDMYILQEKIGEKQVNLALKRFVKDWNAFDLNFDKNRYATSNDLLKYLYEVTPDALKTSVFELLETVTSYDARIKSADLQQKENESFNVAVSIELDKWQSDTKGNLTKILPNNTIMLTVYGLNSDGKEIVIDTKEVVMQSDRKILELNYHTKPSSIVLDNNFQLLDTNRMNNSKSLD